MTITIDKQEILDDVSREVEYIGAKQGDYGRVRLINGDEELLSRWVTDALVSLEQEFHETGCASMASDGVWLFVFRHENGRETWLNSAANTYVESRVTGEWLRLVFPDQADKYFARAGEKLAELRRLAYYRQMPMKKEISGVEVIE